MMALAPTPPEPLQPLLTTTGVAAFVLAMLSALFFAVRRKDREPGMAWFGTGLAIAAAWYGAASRHPGASAFEDPSLWYFVALSTTAIQTITYGLLVYLGVQPARRVAFMPFCLPGLVVLGVLCTGHPVPRLLGSAFLTLPCVGAGIAALRLARANPGVGNAYLGATLLLIAFAPALLTAVGVPAYMVRFTGVVSFLFFGLTLLTVSLLRRRLALEAEVLRRTRAEADVMALNRDLERTVARRTADLQDLVAGLETFNHSVSHDLAGPLGGIAWIARQGADALDRGDAGPARHALSAIAAQAESSTRLVTALLVLARVGGAPVACAPVALGPLVDEALAHARLASPALAATQVTVAPLPAVMGDADLLRPVLQNLLNNAGKFAAGGEAPQVRIHAQEADGRVTVHFADNGIGFPPDQAGSLFQPFRRLHGALFDGSGIGLSIVRRAIERQGGTVHAEGRPGEGATFSFTLPAVSPSSAVGGPSST